MVMLEGVFRIIFEELDPIWLARMWKGPSESRRNMIDSSLCFIFLSVCNVQDVNQVLKKLIRLIK
jgi:predicted small integral membrane protein